MKRKDQSDSLEEALLLSYMRISDENESIRALGDIQLNSPFISNHAMMKAAQQKLYFNIIKQPPPNIRSHNKEVPPDNTPEPDTVDDTSAPAAEVVHETPMNQACPVCNKNFNNKKDMTTHFLHKHTDSETTKEQLKTAKLEIEKVNNSKKELENKVLKTEKQLQSTRAELEETEKKIEKLQQQLKIEFQCHLCDNISQTKQDLNAHFASMHIKKYEDEISRLRTDKSTLDAKVKTLENQLAQKKSENAVIKETLEKEQTQMRSDIEKAQTYIKMLQSKLKSHKCSFKCDECDHQATSTGDLRRHLETLHNQGNLTNLDKLKEELETTRRSESNLKKQLEIFETSKSELSAQLLKLLECTICSNGKVFKSKDDLDIHMKVHIRDLAHHFRSLKQSTVCPICFRFLNSKDDFDTHLKEHIKQLKDRISNLENDITKEQNQCSAYIDHWRKLFSELLNFVNGHTKGISPISELHMQNILERLPDGANKRSLIFEKENLDAYIKNHKTTQNTSSKHKGRRK